MLCRKLGLILTIRNRKPVFGIRFIRYILGMLVQHLSMPRCLENDDDNDDGDDDDKELHSSEMIVDFKVMCLQGIQPSCLST